MRVRGVSRSARPRPLLRRPSATAFREDPRGDDWVLAEAARMMALSLTTPPRAENTSEEPSA
ncbi:hypothetical protein [Streptomyces sp. NPDC088674]|uniref:hypothetical protein n=1 Tax=Streptomyces sp. NPDC088674 TaxID=3365869 RepID=UPI00380939B7